MKHIRQGENNVSTDRCTAWIILEGQGGTITGDFGEPVEFVAGDTILIPAALQNLTVTLPGPTKYLEIILPPTS